MGFNRNNYIRIKEEYNGKYLRAQEAARERRREVESNVAGVSEIDKELSLTCVSIMEAAMKGDMDSVELIRKNNARLMEERGRLLMGAGYPSDYTEIKYECDKCGDTGAVDNKMCSCMRKKLVEAGFESSGMASLIKKQRFDNFSLDYYKNSAEEYKRMSAIFDMLVRYADSFSPNTSQNIALFGGTGLGKTHLSSAIAGRVIENGYDVYYIGAQGLISDFEYNRFGNSSTVGVDGNIERYTECDLLIIDDLGTEMVNQFTTSCLYNVINTRLNKHIPTLISTNLTQDEFRRRYWDRITSRVFGEYVILPFVGTDVRSQKIMKK